MIDLHSHIIYNVDDGSRDEKMSLDMLHIAEEEEIKAIVATPHYICGANRYNPETLKRRFNALKNLIEKHNINVDLYLGNEILMDEYMISHLTQGKCLTLADSDYVLIEMPSIGFPRYTENVIYSLTDRGYKVIIAHPERYREVIKDPNILIKYVKMGCYLQVNTSSIVGLFGEKVQNCAQTLIKNNFIHLVSTDSHTNGKRSPRYKESYVSVKFWVGEEKADELYFNNTEKVLKNEDISINVPYYVEKDKSINNIRKNLLEFLARR